MSVGASTVLLEKAGAADAARRGVRVRRHRAVHRAHFVPRDGRGGRQARISALQGGTLRKCVSAGEALPAATRELWKQHTGIEMIDGIGATEMLHIFISADEAHARPGATGKAVPGYRACVMDDDGQPAPAGDVGKLAVKGPTGCRYLADRAPGAAT